MLAARPDRDELVMAVSAIDPTGPLPALGNIVSYATLAHVARTVSSQAWLWKGWLAQGVLNVLASDPGVGKTRFTLDLSRQLYHALPWPDGQPNTLPAGSRTLWVQGDRNFAEVLQAARDFSLPEEAVVLARGSTSRSDRSTWTTSRRWPPWSTGSAIPACRWSPSTPWESVRRNLMRPDEAREFFAPLLELCQRSGISMLALTHLSANKEALGRRIVEKARVLIKMTQPDSVGQPDRRRLWVDKSAYP